MPDDAAFLGIKEIHGAFAGMGDEDHGVGKSDLIEAGMAGDIHKRDLLERGRSRRKEKGCGKHESNATGEKSTAWKTHLLSDAGQLRPAARRKLC